MGSRYDTQFFPNMSSARITNLAIAHTNGNTYFNTSERHELELLLSKISVAALHNSSERQDAPRCHPGTRVDIQADIMRWLDDVDDPRWVLWMYGSAGVGKSAIIQAIATLCYDSKPRRLAGAFFLSRSAPPESRRGDGKYLVATLAYQMANNIPYLKHHIAKAIERNRVILDLDFETQIEELIIDPLEALSAKTSQKIPPMIFVIDALDECSPMHIQARIVNSFVKAMKKTQHKIPHKLLITSRPESHITSAFVAAEISLDAIVHYMSLDSIRYDAGEDIRKFLVDCFVHFRQTHPSPAIFPPIWPKNDDIESLVRRSSGHFIYASTVQKYIQEKGANPMTRLQTILSLTKDPINQPFAELDALYFHVFRQVKDLETVLHIICISDMGFNFTICENLLGLSKAGVELAVEGLHSVADVAGRLHPYHDSLYDFLKDQHRAGEFFIYSQNICLYLHCLAIEYIRYLVNKKHSRHPDLWRILSPYVMIAAKCSERIERPFVMLHIFIFEDGDIRLLFHFIHTRWSEILIFYFWAIHNTWPCIFIISFWFFVLPTLIRHWKAFIAGKL